MYFSVKQVYEFGQKNFWNHLHKKRQFREFRKHFNLPGHLDNSASGKAFETIYNILRALEPSPRKEIAELPQKEALAILKEIHDFENK
jgi:hypothetical protein